MVNHLARDSKNSRVHSNFEYNFKRAVVLCVH